MIYVVLDLTTMSYPLEWSDEKRWEMERLDRLSVQYEFEQEQLRNTIQQGAEEISDSILALAEDDYSSSDNNYDESADKLIKSLEDLYESYKKSYQSLKGDIAEAYWKSQRDFLRGVVYMHADSPDDEVKDAFTKAGGDFQKLDAWGIGNSKISKDIFEEIGLSVVSANNFINDYFKDELALRLCKLGANFHETNDENKALEIFEKVQMYLSFLDNRLFFTIELVAEWEREGEGENDETDAELAARCYV